jgi:hypothetical protein
VTRYYQALVGFAFSAFVAFFVVLAFAKCACRGAS